MWGLPMTRILLPGKLPIQALLDLDFDLLSCKLILLRFVWKTFLFGETANNLLITILASVCGECIAGFSECRFYHAGAI